jgi:rare lipoprotein A
MKFLLPLTLCLLVVGCASPARRHFDAADYSLGSVYQRGMASWYGGDFDGNRTASGERYNQNDFTAAHKTLPFGTVVRVVNLRNYRSVIVEITDRGPFVKGRVIDVSRAAARELQLIGPGTAPVEIQILRAR